jgi:hypothetical protein
MASKMAEACLEGRSRWEDQARGVRDKDEAGDDSLPEQAFAAPLPEPAPLPEQPAAQAGTAPAPAPEAAQTPAPAPEAAQAPAYAESAEPEGVVD